MKHKESQIQNQTASPNYHPGQFSPSSDLMSMKIPTVLYMIRYKVLKPAKLFGFLAQSFTTNASKHRLHSVSQHTRSMYDLCLRLDNYISQNFLYKRKQITLEAKCFFEQITSEAKCSQVSHIGHFFQFNLGIKQKMHYVKSLVVATS